MVIDISVLDTAGRDDLWARFKVPEWRAFYHTARLRNHPARLKLVLSDSATSTTPDTLSSWEQRETLQFSVGKY